MKKIRTILSMSVLLLGAANIWGQSAHKLTGKILSTKNQPVEGAIVTVLDFSMGCRLLSSTAEIEQPFGGSHYDDSGGTV